MTKTRLWIATGGALALAGCGRLLWLMIDDRSWVWVLGTGVYAAALVSTIVGMWQGKRGALRLSRILALVMFGFGCYAVNFAWTFWLFQEPTLAERIQAVAHPQISAYVAGPVVWVLLSLLPRVREQFKN